MKIACTTGNMFFNTLFPLSSSKMSHLWNDNSFLAFETLSFLLFFQFFVCFFTSKEIYGQYKHKKRSFFLSKTFPQSQIHFSCHEWMIQCVVSALSCFFTHYTHCTFKVETQIAETASIRAGVNVYL